MKEKLHRKEDNWGERRKRIEKKNEMKGEKEKKQNKIIR